MDATLASARHDAPSAPVFSRILCGIDGSPSACEAARQAAALAGPGARLELMAVSSERGYGPSAQSPLSHARAEDALHAAKKSIERAGVQVVLTHRKAPSAAHELLGEAADHDLLVLGSHSVHRRAGILTGSTASRAVHEAPVPVLVARRAPEEAPFPTRILVGADGPGSPEDAIRIAAQLADACGCCVTLLRVGGWHHDRTYAVSRAAVELAEALGSEAVGMVVEGHPHRALVEIAAVENASLIIVGSRGLKGMHALVSTSERVAHEAGCSVLVLRHAKR